MIEDDIKLVKSFAASVSVVRRIDAVAPGELRRLLLSLATEVERLTTRLAIDPGGSDRIDELEAAIGHYKARIEVAQGQVLDQQRRAEIAEMELTELKWRMDGLEK